MVNMSSTHESHHPAHGLRSRPSAGVDWFIPAHLRGGDLDVLRRARLVVTFTWTLIATGIVYSAIFLGMNSPISAAAIGIAMGVGLVALYVIRRTGSPFAAGNLTTAAFFGVLTFLACRLGGHGSLMLPWYAAVPVVALNTAGRRSPVVWLAVTALSLAAFYALDCTGYSFPNDLAPHHYELLCLLAGVGLIVLVLALAYTYDVFKDRMLNHLAQHSRFLTTVVESLAHPFLVIDANDYSIRLANAAARRNGIPGAKTCHALAHGRDAPCETCPLVEVARTGKSIVVDHTHYGADGSPRMCEVHAHPVLDESGRVVQVIEYSLDISDRRQAEEALRESEGRHRAITETAQDAIITADAEGNIRLWNPAAEKIFGFTAAEAVGANMMDLIVPPQYQEAKRKGLAEFALTGSGPAVRKTLELTALRKDRAEFPIEISVSGYRDQESFVAVALVRDVAERKRAEAELEAAHKELRETSRRAGMAEVATGVLHNVGNVLNSVNVAAGVATEKIRQSRAPNLAKTAELMAEHAEDLGTFITQDEKGKHLPGYLAKLAEHLAGEQTALLEELSSLTKNIDHIKSIINMQQSYAGVAGVVEPASLVDLMEDALKINAAAFGRHHIQVVREYSEVPPIILDRHRLLLILVNLLNNGKYALAQRGGPDRRLTLRIGPGPDDRVRIEVADNGVGISPENLTRVFSHGFTTKKKGRGVGLHSSALAAREMGGSLTAHSDGSGKGATFRIELPWQPAETKR